MVITELPSEHAKKALEALCLPAVAPLQVSFIFVNVWTYSLESIEGFHVFNQQDIISQGPVVLGQRPARDLTVHIDRLANIFR